MAKFVEKKSKMHIIKWLQWVSKEIATLLLFLVKIVKFGIGGHPLNYIYYKTATTFKSEI